MFPRINSRMSTSPLYNSTANLARKHSRVSLLAAAALPRPGCSVSPALQSGRPPSAHAAGNIGSHCRHHVAGGPEPVKYLLPWTRLLGVHAPARRCTAEAAAGAQPHLRPADGCAQRPRRPRPRRPAAAKAGAREGRRPRPSCGREGQAPRGRAREGGRAGEGGAAAKAGRPAQGGAADRSDQALPIYDSVTPGSIPASQPAAVYADGAYAASAAQVSGHHSVLWIDTNGSDPAPNVLDVEPGDATPAGAARGCRPTFAPAALGRDRLHDAVRLVGRAGQRGRPARRGSSPTSGTGSPTRPASRTWSRVPAPPSGTGAAATTSAPRTRTSSSSRSSAARRWPAPGATVPPTAAPGPGRDSTGTTTAQLALCSLRDAR